MSDWYVAGLDGVTSGPYTTHAVIEGVKARQISRDAFVAAVDDPQWTPLMTIPDLARALSGGSGPPGPPPRTTKGATPSPSNAPPSPMVAFVEQPSAPSTPSIDAPKPGKEPEKKPEETPSEQKASGEPKPEKPEENKPPQLDPRFRRLPWMIFATFAVVSIVLAILAVVRAEEKEHYGRVDQGTANFQPSVPPLTSSRVGSGRVSM